MSLEQQIAELTATIKTLNDTMMRLMTTSPNTNTNTKTTTTPETTITPEPEQQSFIPEAAKIAPEVTREQLKDICLSLSRDNDTNKAKIKDILFNHFDARKTTDLADNQIQLAYQLILEATK